MDILTAFKIVHELADQNKLDPKDMDSDLQQEAARQQLALDKVHDFIGDMEE